MTIEDIITIDIAGVQTRDKGPFPASIDWIDKALSAAELQAFKDSGVLVLHDGVWCWGRVEDA